MMKTKTKEELNKELRVKIAKLKGLCDNAHYGEKLINDILSIKEQLCVEPTLIHVPCSETQKELDFESFKLYETKSGIIVSANGFRMYVRPWLHSLYGHLKSLIELKGNYDLLTEQEKENYDLLLSGTFSIILNPLICFTNDEYWIDLATYITKKQIEFFQSKLDAPLQEETPIEDEEFRKNILAAERFKQEVLKEGENERGE